MRARSRRSAERPRPRAGAGLVIASYVDEWLPEPCGRRRRAAAPGAAQLLVTPRVIDHGGVAVIVGARRVAGRDTMWCARPASASPDEHDRIFQEFEQVDGGIAGRFGGSGLACASPSASSSAWAAASRRERSASGHLHADAALAAAEGLEAPASATATRGHGGADRGGPGVEASLRRHAADALGARLASSPEMAVAAGLLRSGSGMRWWLLDQALGCIRRPRLSRRRLTAPSHRAGDADDARRSRPRWGGRIYGYLVKPIRAASSRRGYRRDRTQFGLGALG